MNWLIVTITLLGGLALFLHGMDVMTNGLKSVAGSSLKTFLQNMTKNRWTSMLAGMGITAVIQSSSVTTVLAVGFVSAGLMTFESTIGIILGANIGTTITAQIIAFKITKAAWAMIAGGYLISIIFSKKTIHNIGLIIMGLGLVFLGMNVMSDATEPLKNYDPFINTMRGLDNYLIGILIGAAFTAIVQSSSATTGIVIILASQGLVGLEGGIAIILGSNIGTCVTAVLSAIGKPTSAMRVAASHVFIKVVGVLLWFAFIDQLAFIVQQISGGDAAREIANAHTVFNVVNTFLFIWVVHPIAILIRKVVPDKKHKIQPLFPNLDKYYLQNPAFALDLTSHAIVDLGGRTLKIIDDGLQKALVGNENDLKILRQKDIEIDHGHAEILSFLHKIQNKELSTTESSRVERYIEAVNILETTSDLITTDFVETAEHRTQLDFNVSEETIEKLSSLYQEAVDSFYQALSNFSSETSSSTNELNKAAFKQHYLDVRTHLMQRLSATDDNRIAIYKFESEILESIRRLHALARRLDRRAATD